MRFPAAKTLRLSALIILAPLSANAKSNSWWDCFFREFELCSGKVADPDSPEPAAEVSVDGVPTASANASKGFCDSKARSSCDEEEAKKTIKPGGNSANDVKGTKSTITGSGSGAQASNTPANPSKPGERLAAPENGYFVEGEAPTGFKTVLGVDVTLPISEIAEAYRNRNVRGCRNIADSFTRVLCIDTLGAASAANAPIELEFYRGRLAALNFEAKPGAGVKFRPAVSVAEENTGAKAAMSSLASSEPSKGKDAAKAKICVARFPLAGGTLSLHGLSEKSGGDACDAGPLDAATLVRVEWIPASSVQAEIAEQRKNDHGPSTFDLKRDEIEKTKKQLEL